MSKLPLRAPPSAQDFIKTEPIRAQLEGSARYNPWNYAPFNRAPHWGRAYVNITIAGLIIVGGLKYINIERFMSLSKEEQERLSKPLYERPSYSGDSDTSATESSK